jgi:hypothetical protein
MNTSPIYYDGVINPEGKDLEGVVGPGCTSVIVWNSRQGQTRFQNDRLKPRGLHLPHFAKDVKVGPDKRRIETLSNLQNEFRLLQKHRRYPIGEIERATDIQVMVGVMRSLDEYGLQAGGDRGGAGARGDGPSAENGRPSGCGDSTHLDGSLARTSRSSWDEVLRGVRSSS